MGYFYPLIFPFMVLWNGALGNRVVHNEALGVFSTLWLHTKLLRRMPTLCVESGNTHRDHPLFFVKTQARFAKPEARPKCCSISNPQGFYRTL